MSNKRARIHPFCISTFGRHGSVTVSLQSPSPNAKELKSALWKELLLKPATLQCFSLFIGPLGAPVRRLEDAAVVQASNTLCLQRWGADLDKEEKVVRGDEVAIHLLYSEALYYMDTGRIEPTVSEREELDDYQDPNFPTERQFLECVRRVSGYGVFQAKECRLLSRVEHGGILIPAGTEATCICTTTHIVVRTSDCGVVEWEWHHVKRWSALEPHPMSSARFEVCMSKPNIGILEWLHVESAQACLLLQAAMEVCLHLRNTIMPPAMDKYNQVEGRIVDPLHEMLENVLFGAGPRFTSLAPGKTT